MTGVPAYDVVLASATADVVVVAALATIASFDAAAAMQLWFMTGCCCR